MLSSDPGPIECPHCGVRVALTRGICPACRRDAGDLRDAAANRERGRLAAAVRELIGARMCRAVIRRVLMERGEDAQRVDAELRAHQPAYRSAAADRGGRQFVVSGLWLAAAGALAVVGVRVVDVALVALSLGGMHAALGVRQWWQSRRP